ncbi:alpha/beta fold hydrolase [Nocardia puris]|uniref:alpha/beta fold hydrolase n=1 Tax=Nocardia puris TaxID=208602 RepID=UPI001893A85D|nr:alpha/beta fold hydrolase [Nocardia puris]MBF6209546.1 alpha/beta fold hydrolase [Nocardia puris]MBF6366118.1 alpha/beta fold hydrolase [Nocardia puris]MBF6458541.1 alpha/beta fold hydrolase [Nocardia puris]
MGDRCLDRPGAMLRGEEAGAGPTVLLLHAGGERRSVWRPVIDVLTAAGFRCVAYDQRGHGDSGGAARALAPCAGDVAAMVVAEPAGCVLVGASLGGLATIAALRDPAVRARVAGLALVDVVPDADPDRVREFLSEARGYGRYREIVDDIFAQLPRLRATAVELDLPVLLIRAGGASPLTDGDTARFLRAVPHAAVTTIEDAGHLVAREQPVALAEVLSAALSEWTLPTECPATR